MSRNGTQMNWKGAFAPGMVGGRRAHPPKADRVWDKKINVKERRKAIRSALAATIDKNVVTIRGHKVPTNYPFILESSVEDIAKTQQVTEMLMKLKFDDELARAAVKKIRGGIGKTRGRPYQTRIGPLIVVSKACPLMKSASNIAGIDVVDVSKLNASLLAPGTHAGRLTLYTEAALDRMEKEELFR